MKNGETTVLLRNAITEPFIFLSGAAIRDRWRPAFSEWARTLHQTFPLWALHPRAYFGLHNTDLPTVYPLETFVRSIALDEGLIGSPGIAMLSRPQGWLEMVIDSRRCNLCLNETSSWITDSVEEIDGESRFIGTFGLGFPNILDGPILAYHEPDTQYTTGGYISPYEELGLELVRLIQDRESAVIGSAERVDAQCQLDELLKRIAGRVPGRPTIIRDSLARAIFGEGCQLLSACVEAFTTGTPLSERATKVLASHGASTEDHQRAWAARLALPNFSHLELLAIRQRAIDARAGANASMASPEQLTLQLLAHRLRTPIATIARKVMHGWAAEMIEARDEACGICHNIH